MTKRTFRFFIISLFLIWNHYDVTAQNVTNVDDIDGLFYTVQVGTFSSTEIPSSLSGLSDINIEGIDEVRYRYSTGIFREIKYARTRREELLNSGFKGAFVIAYENGERISLRTLRERALENTPINEEKEQSEPVLVTLPAGQEGSKKFDFQLKSGSVLSEATQEVSDLFENQILDYSQEKVVTDTNLVSRLFTLNFDSTSSIYLDSAYKAQLAKRYRGDIGLSFNTWYIYNTEPGFGPNEDVYYTQRANLTLGMDLLNSGLYDNRLQARRIENDIKIQQIKKKEIESIYRYEDIYNYIIYIFNTEKLNTIDERINLLNRQIQIIEMLYTTKDKTWEEVIELKGKIARAQNMYNKWQNYNNLLRDKIMANTDLPVDFNASKLPVLEPIPDSLFAQSMLDSTGNFEELMQLEMENIELKNKSLQNYTLRPFVRYNLIDQDQPFDRTYASAGVSLTVPINFHGSKSVNKYEQQLVTDNHYKKEKNDGHELLNYYYEYSFKYEQLIDFYYTKFKIEERLRREIIKYQFGDISFSPLMAINYMDELMANKLEIIDLKQNLYLKLLRMSEYVEKETPMEYCKELSPSDLLFKYQQKRSTYIWSKFFNAQDNLFLIHYLSNNEIKKVFLSPGPQPLNDKIVDFNKIANKHYITSIAMIGNNKLALEVNETELSDKLNELVSLGFKGFHFDIEPQTFPDWEGNQEFYINNILKVLQIARGIADQNGLEVSMSISIHYPESAIQKIYPFCDEVYLMAYERPDIEFIKRKTQEEFNLDANKTIISIRTKDFPNRLVMEKFIELLDQEMDLEKIAIHDLGTLFELDYDSSLNRNP